MLLHLAVLNNSVRASPSEFERVNVDLTIMVLQKATEAGIPHFVFASSLHALDPKRQSSYATSKRKAAEALTSRSDVRTSVLFLAPVYGDRFSGKLGILNTMPVPIKRFITLSLDAFSPLLHIDRLASCIIAGAESDIVTNRQLNNRVYHGLKRAADVGLSIVVILALGWLLVVLWAAVKFTSPGPALFRQIRVGQDGRLFTCLKFRTMVDGAPNRATHLMDPVSITSVGRWLRKTKLDELPQIFNVLRGEMSFVGPRPCLPIQTELVEERKRRGIFAAKPGISGLSQTERIDMSDPERLARRDADYLALRSIAFDLRIALRTVAEVFRRD